MLLQGGRAKPGTRNFFLKWNCNVYEVSRQLSHESFRKLASLQFFMSVTKISPFIKRKPRALSSSGEETEGLLRLPFVSKRFRQRVLLMEVSALTYEEVSASHRSYDKISFPERRPFRMHINHHKRNSLTSQGTPQFFV